MGFFLRVAKPGVEKKHSGAAAAALFSELSEQANLHTLTLAELEVIQTFRWLLDSESQMILKDWVVTAVVGATPEPKAGGRLAADNPNSQAQKRARATAPAKARASTGSVTRFFG